MTVIELMMASFVLLVGVVAVFGSLTFGATLVGGSRQRSSGSTVALERLERVRNLPFDQVALDEQPVHNSDPGHPDHGVQGDRYDVSSGGSSELETLVVGGVVPHVDDPFTLGKTVFSVHQYVTWAEDDIGSGLKRVVVVVTWKSPVEAGRPNQITQSTVVSDVPRADGSTLVTPTPVPTFGPESSPTPSPPLEGTCQGDAQPPGAAGDGIQAESSVGAEQGFTSTTNVPIRLLATDQSPDNLPCYPLSAELSNDGGTFTVVSTELRSGEPSSVSWTIEDGADGPRTIYGRFRDGAGNVSVVYTIVVTLDRLPPTAPTDLGATACDFVGQGQNRKVKLAWGASVDANLLGYRLYRSIDSAEFQPIKTTGDVSIEDVAKADAGSVRYMVRAYDKAGTESGDSNVVSFAKNSCQGG